MGFLLPKALFTLSKNLRDQDRLNFVILSNFEFDPKFWFLHKIAEFVTIFKIDGLLVIGFTFLDDSRSIHDNALNLLCYSTEVNSLDAHFLLGSSPVWFSLEKGVAKPWKYWLHQDTAHSGFIAGSIETRTTLLAYWTTVRLIPALLPAQLKLLLFELILVRHTAHSGFIAGSIETPILRECHIQLNPLIPALLPAQLKLKIRNPLTSIKYAHSGFIAGSIETRRARQIIRELSELIPALLPAQLKR